MPWSQKLKSIPQEIARYCKVYSHMHHDMSIRHNKYFTWLAIIQVILQSYTAIVITSISQTDGDTTGPLSISGIIAAIGGAICSGIETRFNLRVSTHKNKQYGSAYSKLQRNIEMKLVQERGDVDMFISWASTQYDVLSSESPNIDEDIIKAYGDKHPDLNIYFPGFIRDTDGDRLPDGEKKTPVSPVSAPAEIIPETIESKEPANTTLRRVRSAGTGLSAPDKFQGGESPEEDVELGMVMRGFNQRFGHDNADTIPFDDPRPI